MLRNIMSSLKVKDEDSTKMLVVKALTEGAIEGLVVLGTLGMITSVVKLFNKSQE